MKSWRLAAGCLFSIVSWMISNKLLHEQGEFLAYSGGMAVGMVITMIFAL